MNFTILRLDTVDSTNTEALNQARRGADEGLCVVARQQTAGRGRHGRIWISPPDAGLYLSLVLRPAAEPRFFPLLTFAAAVAVYETLKNFGLAPDIKWANDVLVRGKKIFGILAETGETPKGLAVVVGIGLNLKSVNFPAELNETATSIEAETALAPDGGELLENLTRFLIYYYQVFQSAGGAGKIRRAWAERSSYFSGKEVKVALAGETFCGTTRGIEESGALRVEAGGEIKIIHAGDVTQLRPA
jgi:BirA family transcriptional regulator, biotin operon repressor / biotin---[acetyl-CoA-carboxylase] ligase